MTKRIMVDMSATLIHHGHIRILKKASDHGRVIVGLTTDEQIRKHKSYTPELDFEARKEILLAIRHVNEVVATPWLITESVLEQYEIDLLVHGDDNQNHIAQERLIILPRTEGISSTQLRLRSVESLASINQRTS
jgi:glycerol-3-phosphate cytidylyltransferase